MLQTRPLRIYSACSWRILSLQVYWKPTIYYTPGFPPGQACFTNFLKLSLAAVIFFRLTTCFANFLLDRTWISGNDNSGQPGVQIYSGRNSVVMSLFAQLVKKTSSWRLSIVIGSFDPLILLFQFTISSSGTRWVALNRFVTKTIVFTWSGQVNLMKRYRFVEGGFQHLGFRRKSMPVIRRNYPISISRIVCGYSAGMYDNSKLGCFPGIAWFHQEKLTTF